MLSRVFLHHHSHHFPFRAIILNISYYRWCQHLLRHCGSTWGVCGIEDPGRNEQGEEAGANVAKGGCGGRRHQKRRSCEHQGAACGYECFPPSLVAASDICVRSNMMPRRHFPSFPSLTHYVPLPGQSNEVQAAVSAFRLSQVCQRLLMEIEAETCGAKTEGCNTQQVLKDQTIVALRKGGVLGKEGSIVCTPFCMSSPRTISCSRYSGLACTPVRGRVHGRSSAICLFCMSMDVVFRKNAQLRAFLEKWSFEVAITCVPEKYAPWSVPVAKHRILMSCFFARQETTWKTWRPLSMLVAAVGGRIISAIEMLERRNEICRPSHFRGCAGLHTPALYDKV